MTQKQVHRTVHTALPQGWDYQIRNEPIFNFVYEHRRKYRFLGGERGLAAEAVPAGTVMLGNWLTQAQIGGQARLGYNVPDDFGTTFMRGMGHLPPPRVADPLTQPRLGVFVYGGLHGNMVLQNVTLDGNTWKESPSVEKELFVPAAEVGLAVATPRFVAAFSYVFLGQEFKGQPDNSEFGAITVTCRF